MIDPTLIIGGLAIVGAVPPGVVLGLRYRDGRRWLAELEPYRLQLPRDLDLSAVGTFLDGLSGLLPMSWRRPIAMRGIAYEVVSNAVGISHHLVLPRSQRDIVLSGLRGALPNVGIIPEPDYRLTLPTLAGELSTAQPHHQLQVDHPDRTSRALLAALQPLDEDEVLSIALLLFPLGHSQPPQSLQTSIIGRLKTGTAPAVQPPKAVQEKYARPQFGVVARIGVTSATRARDRQLLSRLSAAFHSANSEHAHLRRRRVSGRAAVTALVNREFPVTGYPCRLNSRELVGLLALPASGVSLPGLRLGGARQLAPSSAIPTTGRVVADATFPGMARPLAISVRSSLMHTHVLGPSGVGKSTLLDNLYTQDAAAGFGIALIDPKNDLGDDALNHTPLNRDVVVIDPNDDRRPVGLNLFAGGDRDPELISEQLTSVMHRLYAANWGPRTDHVLRHAVLSLVRLPGASFTDLPLLLTNADFRRHVVGQLDDPIALNPFWAEFEAMSGPERSQVVGPLLNKLSAIVARPRLRRVLGQADSQVDFDDILASGKILIVQLSAGKLGEDAAALLGSFVLQKLWAAIQRRIRLPQSERRPFFVYVDEFQLMTNLASPLPDVLAQARAMGVGLILAHQHLAQLDRETREAVLANCRSRVLFQLSASDARTMAPYVAPYLGPQDLQGLGPFEVVATLAGNGATVPPVTGRTRPAPPSLGHGAELRRRSRNRYGRNATEIDAELRRRQQRLTGSGPIGRQRRSE